MYIWQANNWPNLSYQKSVFQQKLQSVLVIQQQLRGKVKELPEGLDHHAEMDALVQNALQTSEIEGESLNIGSVRSSVVKHLGLEQAGLIVGKRSPVTPQTESLIAMLRNAISNFKSPVDQKTLCSWQAALFPEPPLLRKIIIGDLRGEAKMQVVSEKARREIVHFEAPPKKHLQKELNSFLKWFNVDSFDASNSMEQFIIRAGIAHLWFLTIHPFDDGNGRVARALTDRALAQAEQTSIRFYSLSASIEKKRASYYEILEKTQSCNTNSQLKNDHAKTDITDWLVWFIDVLGHSIQQGINRIDKVVNKARFWQKNSQTILIERQVKVLNRLLDSDDLEFPNGINATQYKRLAKVSKATATRDLSDLLSKRCIKKLAGGGRSTRYCIC